MKKNKSFTQPQSCSKTGAGFTLVELLVVVVIIGLLSAVAVGSISKARERARIAKNLEFSQSIFSGLGSHAVAIWSFDTVGAGIAPDISRNGNDGKLYGDTSQTDDTPYATITSALGKYALSFDGNGDYVECQDSDSLDPGDQAQTIELWFNWDGSSGKNTLYNKEGLYEARVFNGFFEYNWQPDGNWNGGTSFPVAANRWHHAVLVYNKEKQYLYQDGRLVFSKAQTGDIGENDSKFLIGAKGNNNPKHYFSGKIDDLRVYSAALSGAEIQKHYVQGRQE